MKIARALSSLIESFEKLPGIGPKTAQRLSYYLLHVPQSYLDEFADNLVRLKKDTVTCSVCNNVGEENPCSICSDKYRDISMIMVVEQPLDLIAFERGGKYKGLYHVLHGAISPLDNIGPDEIFIDGLIKRIRQDKGKNLEVIIATNPTMEGEATAMYIKRKVQDLGKKSIILTRLGMGIPTGADLEYADEVTLARSFEGRQKL